MIRRLYIIIINKPLRKKTVIHDKSPKNSREENGKSNFAENQTVFVRINSADL